MGLTLARVGLRMVGGITLACAVVGILYNVTMVLGFANLGPSGFDFDLEAPFFPQAFYILTSIAVAGYVLLGWCGIQFLRLSGLLWWLFTTILVAEVILSHTVVYLSLHPQYGSSIAAASGVSLGGITPQMYILLPLWGPLMVWLMRRSLQGEAKETKYGLPE